MKKFLQSDEALSLVVALGGVFFFVTVIL